MNNLTWVKSSYSSGQGDNCVEVATLPEGGLAVRDSKDIKGPVLDFTATEWRAFVRDVKAAKPAI
jgi:Domain of unknown function (DUF397)